MTSPVCTPTENAWRRFWNRGGWWRSLLLVVVYYAVYQLVPLVTLGPFVRNVTDPVASLWVGQVVPIAFGGVILVLFALSLAWMPELFGRQPIRGRGWMWIAVAVVLLFNVLHFASTDYAKAGAGYALVWLASGLVIGFAEETLTRGFVVNLLRKAGYREISVAAISSALFAALHAGNLFGGQALATTVIQVLYTFAFGVCMYLTLRVTGRLIWPILLHASTDPSIFMQGAYPAAGGLADIAGLGNFAVIGTGLILLIFIRGKVSTAADGVDAVAATAR